MRYNAVKFSEKEIADYIETKLYKLSTESLKINLYLIRAGIVGETFTAEDIADHLGTTEKKARIIIEAWKKSGMITEAEEKQLTKEEEDLQLCLYFYSLFKGEDADLGEVSDIRKIHDKFHIDSDYFSYITEYCSQKKKLHTGYMLKLAEDWTGKGIRDRNQAELYVMNKNSKLSAVKKAFAIKNRDLAPVEVAYVESWTYSPQMIGLACSRALHYTGNINFRYADAIMKNWTEKGIMTMEEAEADQPPSKFESKKPSNSFHNFNQRDYDYDELERKLLARYQNY